MKTMLEVYDFLAPKLSFLGDIYIAGGAVRDHLMNRTAKDFDLFILGDVVDTVAYPNKFKEMCELELSLNVFDNNLEWHKSEPFLLTNIRLDMETEVQVMHRSLRDVEELVDTFDWNVSRFAYGEEGFIQKTNIADIAEGKYLELHKVTYPASTLRRGYRFSERFGMRLRAADLQKLCWGVCGDKLTDYQV